jgi:hypothetical protein
VRTGIQLSYVLLKAERQVRCQGMNIKALFVPEGTRQCIRLGGAIIVRPQCRSLRIGDIRAARVETGKQTNSEQQTDRDYFRFFTHLNQ